MLQRKYIFLAAGLILLLLFAGERYLTINPIIQTSQNFITAVAQGKEISTFATEGVMKQAIKPEQSSLIQNIDVSVVSFSKRWAKCRLTAEITLPDGSADIGWYELELVKNDVWKVNRISKTSPVTNGRSRRLKHEDTNEINQVFVNYLRAIQQADYRNSIKYLAGPAREIHNDYQQQLSKEPLIKEFEDLTSSLLWTDRKYAVMEFIYTVNGRKALVQAGFYKTKQGWRMVKI